MKKIYLFLLILLLIGCETLPLIKNKSILVDCPNVLFSKEHKVYLDSNENDINFDNITYKSVINNADFLKGCSKIDDYFSSDLSILFIVNPIANNQKQINLPFYLAFLDETNKVYEINYYSLSDYFTKDQQSLILSEKSISHKISIYTNKLKENSTILIGFMLDEKRLDLIN